MNQEIHVAGIASIAKPLAEAVLSSLSDLQLSLLIMVSENELHNATNLSHSFSEKKDVPLSTVWHNLRQLRQKKLVSFGCEELIELTAAGRFLIDIPAVAQLVERSAVTQPFSESQCKSAGGKDCRNREVAGANPARGTNVSRGES